MKKVKFLISTWLKVYYGPQSHVAPASLTKDDLEILVLLLYSRWNYREHAGFMGD